MGFLAFVTNHGYLDNPTFRGMRQSLMQSFDDIYVLDLHGNSKKKERSPDGSKDENVFDIQQGVAIGIFVKRQKKISLSRIANVYHSHLWGLREVYEKVEHEQRLIDGKYHWLAEHDVNTTEWTKLEPQTPFYLFKPQSTSTKSEYEFGWKVTDIFPINSTGVKTHRDHFAVDIDYQELRKRIVEVRNLSLSDDYIMEKYNISDTRDWKLKKGRNFLAHSNQWEDYFTQCLYRPFDIRAYYHHDSVVEIPRNEVMDHMLAGNNLGLATTRAVEIGRGWEHVLCSDKIIQHHTVSLKETNYFFPLYLNPEKPKKTLFDFGNEITTNKRRNNFSKEFIDAIGKRLQISFVTEGKGDLQHTFGPEDIFNYMYAIFYSPTYRQRYSEFLKVDFPRLPLISNSDLFQKISIIGDRLVMLHLMKQTGKITAKYPISGNNVVEKIEYIQHVDAPEQSRVWINKTQYFECVPFDVWDFHIGGYQICHKWLKDRKGRRLEFSDIMHYQRIVAALAETITLMEQIDVTIDEHGSWPIQ